MKTVVKPDYRQQNLLAKIQQYLQAKKDSNRDPRASYTTELPFKNRDGICSGIVSLVMYHLLIGTESKVKKQVDDTLNWNPNVLHGNRFNVDPDMEEFLHSVLFLHNDNQLRDVERHDLDKSFGLLLADDLPKVAPPEFSMTFVFSKAQLEALISECMHQNKIVRFGNGFHTVGALRRGDMYYFLNPSSGDWIVGLNSARALTREVFKSLAEYCGSGSHIALNMLCFGLVGSAKDTYPDKLDYCHALLENSSTSKAFFSHPNILRVTLKYDPAILGMLAVRGGYSYVTSNKYETTELGEAAAEHKLKQIKYLLDRGVPIDYKPKYGESALGTAVRFGVNDALYLLLQQGADPNIAVHGKTSALEWALTHVQKEAIIILLAVGAKFDAAFMAKLARKYRSEDVRDIKQHAVDLNAQLLHLPRPNNTRDFASPLLFSDPKERRMDLSYEREVSPLLTLKL